MVQKSGQSRNPPDFETGFYNLPRRACVQLPFLVFKFCILYFKSKWPSPNTSNFAFFPSKHTDANRAK